ncbi:MAG: fructosamine kinase family protein [Spirochaetota bacterium]
MRAAAWAEIAPSVGSITGKWYTAEPLAGGDIASVLLVTADRGRFVLKTHQNPPAGFFAAEAAGLASLAHRGVRVPVVFAQGENHLLLEYLETAAPNHFAAGVMLAQLHDLPCESFGAEADNYLATIRQPNAPTHDWPHFFCSQRLQFCLDRLAGLSAHERNRWQQFATEIRVFLETCPKASWLHGDLWSGNLLMGQQGPVFIDPACYAGDALVDIAMTQLFGGFMPGFYEGYRSVLPRREHEAELIRIYQLYPLLVHAILFDAGDCRQSAYYRRAVAVREAFF